MNAGFAQPYIAPVEHAEYRCTIWHKDIGMIYGGHSNAHFGTLVFYFDSFCANQTCVKETGETNKLFPLS